VPRNDLRAACCLKKCADTESMPNEGGNPVSTARHPPSQREIVAALIIGSVALLIPGLQPILLGELVAQKRISLEGVGLVAMGEIIALGIGVILGNSLLSPRRLPATTVFAALLVAFFDLLTLRLEGDMAFSVVRALCGVAEGVIVWVTTCVIVRSAAPDRLAGVYLVVQTLAQAAVAAILAWAVIPRYGWQGGFGVLAGLSVGSLVLVPVLRLQITQLVAERSGPPPLSAATIVTFLVVVAQMGATGSLWAYLDPLGRHSGLDEESAQALVSLVLMMQVAGGSVAAIIVRRRTAIPILLAASLLQATIAFALYAIAGPAVTLFATLCAVFGFVWLFVMPFHIRLAFDADPAGRVAVLVPASQLLGVALGPLLASFFVTGDDARPVALVCAGFALAAACLLLAGRLRIGAGRAGRPQFHEQNARKGR
jgi:MFS transporter, DHA1 family, inner membrane transport protein